MNNWCGAKLRQKAQIAYLRFYSLRLFREKRLTCSRFLIIAGLLEVPVFLITRINFYMKYLFYIVVIAFIYRVIFRPKVIVEHRHFTDKKPDEKQKKQRPDAELTDYEEIK